MRVLDQPMARLVVLTLSLQALGCSPDDTPPPVQVAPAAIEAAAAVQAPAAPSGPPPDPAVFAPEEGDTWPVVELPRAGIRLRVAPDAQITESGRFSSGPQAGPYVGVLLPGGLDVQIDGLDADVEWSRQDAVARAAAGELSILHSEANELVTQPAEVDGCRVTVCRALQAGQVCASKGSVSVYGQEGVRYPTLRDCGVLLSMVRSIAPL